MSMRSENVVDDWECIDDSDLNTKVSQIKKNATNNQSNSNAGIECSRPFAAMLLNDDDDCMRTQYVPPEPTVKILKRPTNDKNNQQLLAEQKPKAPIKTLQQREQEYAEARLRILGSAKSEEDEETPAATEKNGTPNFNNANGYTNRNAVNQGNSMNNSPRTFARNAQPQQFNSYLHHQQQIHQLQQQQQTAFQIPNEMRRIEDNVIRLPRGPDGTTGFIVKR